LLDGRDTKSRRRREGRVNGAGSKKSGKGGVRESGAELWNLNGGCCGESCTNAGGGSIGGGKWEKPRLTIVEK